MIKKGFTLAEVLITLGIIGVIAALTIPHLFNNTKNAHLGSQYAKAISTLENSIGIYLYDNNVKNLVQLSSAGTSTPTPSQLLSTLHSEKYIKMTPVTNNTGLPCGGTGYMLPDKSIIGVCGDVPLTVHQGDATQELYFLSSKSVNQKAQIEGLDFFKMSLSADGLIYIPCADYDTNGDCKCTQIDGGRGCAGRVAKNGWKFSEEVYTDTASGGTVNNPS